MIPESFHIPGHEACSLLRKKVAHNIIFNTKRDAKRITYNAGKEGRIINNCREIVSFTGMECMSSAPPRMGLVQPSPFRGIKRSGISGNRPFSANGVEWNSATLQVRELLKAASLYTRPFFLAPFLANQAFSCGRNGSFGIATEVSLSFSYASV